MIVLKFLCVFLPWPLKRLVLKKIFKYDIDQSAKIGLAWVYPKHLQMKPYSRIAHFTVGIHLDRIVLGEFSTIGRNNWITGFPSGTMSRHFNHQEDRSSELIIGDHSAITKNHHIDCTHTISIGHYVTIAGYYSQLLTHSIDIINCRQHSEPIKIEDYCFIGTNCVILGGSTLPSYSVLGAKSLLNKAYSDCYILYAGVPAKPVKNIPQDAKYFERITGFVC